MAVWLVRAGGRGERQDFALDKNLVAIGWDGIPDLAQYKTREELAQAYREVDPNAKTNQLRNWVCQLWAFSHRIQHGDLVVLPLKGQNAIAIGRVTGDYQHRPDHPSGAKHTRPVEWITQDMSRDRFDQDLLYSFGASMTVCQIKRNNAEARIQAILKGEKPLSPPPTDDQQDDSDEVSDTTAMPDLADYATTLIRTHIGQKFAGHKLADLVNAVLEAQGYQTAVADPGPDGGVDIIAGRGPMGFDPPRLCVQVKSSTLPLDVKVLRELKGVMKDFGADQGLLVSWGGFKRTVLNEARRAYFEIRLWDASNLVESIQTHYEKFSDELRADLPLKRVWTLVQED